MAAKIFGHSIAKTRVLLDANNLELCAISRLPSLQSF
jgi:hypothetical protein